MLSCGISEAQAGKNLDQVSSKQLAIELLGKAYVETIESLESRRLKTPGQLEIIQNLADARDEEGFELSSSILRTLISRAEAKKRVLSAAKKTLEIVDHYCGEEFEFKLSLVRRHILNPKNEIKLKKIGRTQSPLKA